MPSIDIVTVPRRRDTVLFETKAWCHRLLRWWREAGNPPPRHPPSDGLVEAPVLAEFRGDLWSDDATDPRWVAGKVQNLRLAAHAFHGIEPAPGAVMSFWRQLGRASRRRGFALGRELREGCLVPSRGGGLCQLSNALHDCALRAGLRVVERHRHTQILPGSLAERDRDATVFWNYLDLRLTAPFAWRVEVQLDATHLQVRIRGHAPGATVLAPRMPDAGRPTAPVADCGACGRVACHRHEAARPHRSMTRTWLVSEDWPEYRRYRNAERRTGDREIRMPVHSGWWTRIARRLATTRRMPVPQTRIEALQREARALARCLRPLDGELVVPQGVLPFLWQAGLLGGRRFDVLMGALPMGELQRRLDAAVARHPQSPTLADYRGPSWLVEAEAQALAAASRWITPHAEVAAQAGLRALLIPWERPAPVRRAPSSPGTGECHLLLAGPSLARKGVLELREALRGLPGIVLLLLPRAREATDFWDGFRTRTVASLEEGVALADGVVLPAWIEHQPRGLLLALASGVPVIATAACGVPPDGSWHCVPTGDVSALEDALRRLLATVTRA